MPTKSFEKNPKITRSARLRKYESAYKAYLRKTEQSKISKSPRIPRKKRRMPVVTSRSGPRPKNISRREVKKKHKICTSTVSKSKPKKEKRRPLNAYQKFVQNESKKSKYKNIPGKKRLSIIAEEWKRRSS